MRPRALGVGALVALTAAVAAGCGEGGAPGDLFVVERTGSVPGARLTVRFIDDGGASCNDGPRVDITSDQLLEARELRRALDGDERDSDEPGLAERGLVLPPAEGGPGSVFSFSVRSEQGTIRFADTSRGDSEALPRIIKLTRDVARDACGLVR